MLNGIYDAVAHLRNPTAAYAPGALAGNNPGVGSLDGIYNLGGYRAQDPKPVRSRLLFPRGNVYRLFRNVQNSELAGGATAYRALALETGVTLTHLWVWLDATPTPGNVAMSIGVDPAAANAKGAVASSESSAPAGVAFSAPITQGTALDMGPLTVPAAGTLQSRILWVKRIVPGGASAWQGDNFTLHYQIDGGAAQSLLFWWNAEAAVTIQRPVTYDHVGKVVTPQNTVAFTINVLNSSLAATDPANTTVWVGVTCTTTDSPWGSQPYQGERLVDQALKTSTGVYRYEFTPPIPGQYHFDFDIGDDSAGFSIWVSPVA
jgi:hypothetical protein